MHMRRVVVPWLIMESRSDDLVVVVGTASPCGVTRRWGPATAPERVSRVPTCPGQDVQVGVWIPARSVSSDRGATAMTVLFASKSGDDWHTETAHGSVQFDRADTTW